MITHAPCAGPVAASPGVLLIDATIAAIDGVDGILAEAGTTITRSCNINIANEGEMIFDIADITSMENDGIFSSTVLHEMAHVIGVGCVWSCIVSSPYGTRTLQVTQFQFIEGAATNNVVVSHAMALTYILGAGKVSDMEGNKRICV